MPDDSDSTKVELYSYINNEIILIDSTYTRNKSFVFEGEENIEDLSFIVFNEDFSLSQKINLILERGDINIQVKSPEYFSIVSGTPLNDLYQEYKDSCDTYRFMMQKIPDDNPQLFIYGSEKHKLIQKQGHYMQSFKIDNINNKLGQALFIRELGNIPEHFSNADSVDYEILKLLDPEIKARPAIINYFAKKEKQRQQTETLKETKNKQYFDYCLSDADGDKKCISNFVGKSKFLYIDFWASWCGPCVREMPNLKKIYEEYKDKGLQIISISLDTDEAKWKQGIKKIDVPWVHLSDLKGDESGVNKLYNVDGIPHGVLIDEKGYVLIPKANAKSLEISLRDLFAPETE